MRTCFLLKVRAEMVEEYKKRHAAVWPEMVQALNESGWRNYSLFLRPDGLVVGYLEADDFENACAKMKKQAVNARWQASVASLFECFDEGGPDDHMIPLNEVFHLD